jgi:hypothetical protein
MSEEKSGAMSRRDFLKVAAVAGVAVQAGVVFGSGITEGSSHKSYTGWEANNPGSMFFNRKPFEFTGPAHTPVGTVRRPSHITDYVFGRVGVFESAYEKNPTWTLDDPIEDLGLPPPVTAFYNKFPERLEWDYRTFSETIPNNQEDKKKYGNYYLLANAYESGFSATANPLPRPQGPPEESDTMKMGRGGPEPLGEPLPFKTPELAAEFIKEMAHR